MTLCGAPLRRHVRCLFFVAHRSREDLSLHLPIQFALIRSSHVLVEMRRGATDAHPADNVCLNRLPTIGAFAQVMSPANAPDQSTTNNSPPSLYDLDVPIASTLFASSWGEHLLRLLVVVTEPPLDFVLQVAREYLRHLPARFATEVQFFEVLE